MSDVPSSRVSGRDETPATRDPGWYPTGDVSGGLRWWDGSKWTVHSSRKLVGMAPRSARRVRTVLALGVSVLLASVLFAWLGGSSMERECRRTSPHDVNRCLSDSSMGVEMIGLVGFAAGSTLLVIGIRGARRRRRAALRQPHHEPDPETTT